MHNFTEFSESVAILTFASPSGSYRVTNALIHDLSDSYKFAGGEETAINSADDEDAWDVDITVNEDGSCVVSNLIDWGQTLTGTYDSSTGKIVLPAQTLPDYESMGVCGGLKGYTEVQDLMDYIDTYNSYVPANPAAVSISLKYDEKANTLTLDTPILVYYPDDSYQGYIGTAYCMYSGIKLAGEQPVGEDMSMFVTVYGLDKFENLAIMPNGGETGMAIAMESQLKEGEAVQVWFTNLDLPLEIFGSWAAGTDYKMTVTLDGVEIPGIALNSTSAQFVDIEAKDGANLVISLEGENLPAELVTLSVNEPAGVRVEVETVDDTYTAMFYSGNTVEINDPLFIRIYNVKPYKISSVKVNGEEVEAIDGGEYYFIQPNAATETIEITVEEVEVKEMSMNVTVEGLDKFINLAILDKQGETSKALAMESQLKEGEAVPVWFDNFDLPLQVFGSWAEGTNYTMTVTLDGEEIAPVVSGPTSAQFVNIEPAEGANMVISLTGSVIPSEKVAISVNEPEGVNVVADVEVDGEYDTVNVEFVEGAAEVNGAQVIKIYNVEPYIITSVKVNGEEIAAENAGEYYFIEPNVTTETIEITVEKQEVVEMSMNVTVEGLDKFQKLAIMGKGGEINKALAMESQLKEGEAVPVYFTNFDLPLEIYGEWADGTNYTMTVTLDGEALAPVVSGPTSAQFVNIEPAEGANMVISLTGSVIPSEKVAITVNEAAGVQVIADVEVDGESDTVTVEFEEGKAEVEHAQYIRIYNVDPYTIASVKVNGEEIAAQEGGRSYFIEMTAAIETIDITVEEQEVVEMEMMVMIQGLDKFEDLVILDKDGENGKALASKMNFEDLAEDGMVLTDVHFTNLDLPLQVFGTWADGTTYKMEVSVDGEPVIAVQEGPTSALFTDIYVENEQFLTISLTGEVLPAETVTLTVNEPAGVNVVVDTEVEGEPAIINVEFTDGTAEVEAPQVIRIYNVEPYLITSVKVNGEEIAPEEGGEYYFIEPNAATKTIAIEVEEQEVVEMSMNVTVEGLDKFINLAILDKTGEGKAIAMEANFVEGEAVPVYFTNFDLPLQVFGSWADGTDYKMVVTLDGEAVAPVMEGPTSAQFVDIEPAEGANMVISLTGAVLPSEKVAITVNEAAGVNVLVDTEEDVINVEFADGKAEVEGAQIVRIYNVEPYIITSVKVNGEEIAAEEGGEYYFIEMTAAIETIAIEVEEQEVVEMSMNVTVEGLDKFQNLAIFGKQGETGKAIAMEQNFVEGEATPVWFTNFDLPLQVFGSWADGTAYTMTVTLDGEAIAPVMEGPTSAQFVNIEPAEGANMVISLTGAVLPSESVTLTVNEAAGVNVIADTEVDGEYDTVNVEFVDGNAEVKGAQVIRIYNVEPYIITSVKVNGEEIAAEEGGEYYFIEMTAAIETIDITVEEQEVVEMSMMVTVEGLDKFENLAILGKQGETGKAIAMEANFTEGQAVEVFYTNFDLPLQVFGSWADGTDYKMVVTLDGEAVAAAQEGPTSALFMNIEPAEGAQMVISLTGAVLPSEKVAITVNEAAGVNVMVDTEEDVINVEFADGKAEVEGAQIVRIYNVEPYIITSVKVNGEEIAAVEGGEYYFIEMTAAIETIDITVEEQEVVEMSMMVTVEGLDKFENLAILGKQGETGKAIAMEANFTEGQAVEVFYTNFDLPLQVFGSWADGTDYKMVVTLDGEAVAAAQEGPTSALFMNIEPAEGAQMVISLTGAVLPSEKVAITVNEAAGVNVMVDTEEDVINVEFADGKAEVEGAQIVRIYNVEPYIITSVKVNGEEIAAVEGGEYYFIEMTAAIETIDITVEEQEVVEMSMMVTVEGLDKFQNLAIFGKQGETGKAIAMEANFVEGEATPVWFTNFDLPLQVYGSWADGTDYKMVVTLDGEAVAPVMEGPTSAQFINIEPAEGAQMVISLTGSVIPSEKVAITVNEPAGVFVMADTEDDVIDVEFADGKAEVEGAQYIRIYNVDPYIITSVKVNGEEIAAEEGGTYYFIEMTAAIETIDITVEEQEVVEISMMVIVEGLDKFEDLVIMDKNGELGKAIASKENFEAEAFDGMAIVDVHFTNLDLPLQVYGTWEEGNDYKMEVTIEGAPVEAVQEGPTSALFMDIFVEDNAMLTISLKGGTSAINKVDAEQKAGKWYNLQGIEINKANLMPGNVYINAGQKYLVK